MPPPDDGALGRLRLREYRSATAAAIMQPIGIEQFLEKKGNDSTGPRRVGPVLGIPLPDEDLFGPDPDSGSDARDHGQQEVPARRLGKNTGPKEKKDRGIDRVPDVMVRTARHQSPLGGISRRMKAPPTECEPGPKHEQGRENLEGDRNPAATEQSVAEIETQNRPNQDHRCKS